MPIEPNKRYGRLVVLSRYCDNGELTDKWMCLCDCGTTKLVSYECLRSVKTKSCGCLRKETTIKRFVTHGMRKSPEYSVWLGMRRRCSDPKNRYFDDYGGRGIYVCTQWNDDFSCFLKDIGLRPSSKHSLERIDNNKGYAPDNCRWALYTDQANNRRSNRLHEFRGNMLTVRQLMKHRKNDISYRTLSARILEKGWNIEEALTVPNLRPRRCRLRTAA